MILYSKVKFACHNIHRKSDSICPIFYHLLAASCTIGAVGSPNISDVHTGNGKLFEGERIGEVSGKSLTSSFDFISAYKFNSAGIRGCCLRRISCVSHVQGVKFTSTPC